MKTKLAVNKSKSILLSPPFHHASTVGYTTGSMHLLSDVYRGESRSGLLPWLNQMTFTIIGSQSITYANSIVCYAVHLHDYPGLATLTSHLRI